MKGFEELFLKQRLDAKVKELRPEHAALLTPKRIELLRVLATLRVESTNDLAKKLNETSKTFTRTPKSSKK